MNTGERMVRVPRETEEMNMETISKNSIQGMVVSAVAALVLTWSVSAAFVQSTSVARWVTAGEVASHMVAVAASQADSVKGAAASLLQ